MDFSRFNPGNAMTSMVANMLPNVEKQFAHKLSQYENPEHEDFMLPPGYDKVSYNVVAVNGQLIISLHAIKINQDGTATMTKPVKSFPLSDLLKTSK